MGSFSHIVEDKKELVREIHYLAKLGIRLVNSAEGSIWVQNSSESYLESEVKELKNRDPILAKLKEVVRDQKVEVFS